MRVAVTVATGNVGTSLLHVLAQDPAVDETVAIARRLPRLELPRTRFVAADVARDNLVEHFRGADAVVHLAWLIQPSRDRALSHGVNVGGSRRVFEAAAAAGVPRLVYASSVGAYSPGPKDRRVDERWPTNGIPTSFYSRDKAEVERLLDAFEAQHPDVRVVRLRPGLIFKAEAASGIRRLFAGPLLPTTLLRRRLIPIVPALERLRFQAVHSLDVAEAYHWPSRATSAGRSTSPPSRCSIRSSSRVCSARVPCRYHGRRCGRQSTSAGSCACSRRRRAGWTWRSACR